MAQLASGAMRIPVDQVFPLAEADSALAALAGRRVRGKVLIDTRA
jgi:NADPH:quinone reductase-like Zn-dependent oxidoreductase